MEEYSYTSTTPLGHIGPVMGSLYLLRLLVIKPTRRTNFSILFLEWNSTCFRQFFCPPSGIFHCTHSNSICHTGLLTACERAVSKPVWHIPLLCVQWEIPDDGQGNCPKHVEFHFKNKIEKSVHLVGFIIRIYHDARSPERQSSTSPVQQFHTHTVHYQLDAQCFCIYYTQLYRFQLYILAIFRELQVWMTCTGIWQGVIGNWQMIYTHI